MRITNEKREEIKKYEINEFQEIIKKGFRIFFPSYIILHGIISTELEENTRGYSFKLRHIELERTVRIHISSSIYTELGCKFSKGDEVNVTCRPSLLSNYNIISSYAKDIHLLKKEQEKYYRDDTEFEQQDDDKNKKNIKEKSKEVAIKSERIKQAIGLTYAGLIAVIVIALVIGFIFGISLD